MDFAMSLMSENKEICDTLNQGQVLWANPNPMEPTPLSCYNTIIAIDLDDVIHIFRQ